MWGHPETFSKYLPYVAFSWISFCLPPYLLQHTATLLHHSLYFSNRKPPSSSVTPSVRAAPSLPTNSLFMQCKLLHYSQTFIMLYALVQLPTSSFCYPPTHPTPPPFNVPHVVHDGIHLTLTYEYSFRSAPYPLNMVPGHFYSGVHSPFW